MYNNYTNKTRSSARLNKSEETAMTREQIQELRRVLNQTSTLLEAATGLASADEGPQKRLRDLRGRLRNEQSSLDERLSEMPRLPAASRAY